MIGLLLVVVIRWGAQLLQAIAFAISLLQLFGAPPSQQNFASALAIYTLGHYGLARYRPRVAYVVRLLFCGAWVVLSALWMTQLTSWPWLVNVVIGGFLGGCLGGRVNFGSPRALLAYLEIEAGALADWVSSVAARLRPQRAPELTRPRESEPLPPVRPRPSRGRTWQSHEHSHREEARTRTPPPRDPPRPPPPPPPRPDDPWTVLGVSRDASREVIRRAYIELVRQYHPDRVANLGPELRALAEEKTKQINRAYETLRGRR